MSITTTGFYGLQRDFLSMIPMGYTAFTAAKGRSYEVLDEAAKADALRKQAQREAWRKRQDRKNELNRAARAKGKPAKSRADLVLRSNEFEPDRSPEARAALKKELDASYKRDKKARQNKLLTERVLRVNPYSPVCEPSGFAVHKAEIRRELAKTKPAISAN